ncbi:hypothetical protein SGCOL_010100 [Colletotrichum sp. CLE4]
MFSNLEHEEGMIQYIGWFGSFELGDDDAKQEYFNIVLELADFDFYEAVMRLSPPISSEEIHGFWESMFEISKTLASIHTITIDKLNFWTWHGDIKPENILRVNDRFKLADPGEASMLLKNSGTPYLPPSRSLGGTRTYAAPEKTAYLDDISTKMPKKTSVKGKTSNSKESLDALTELDSRLEEEYKGRDIVFLVDNGTTMRKWWSSVIDLLEVMVWRALAYDDDGMEMYFTNPDTNPRAIVRGSKSQSAKDFTKALEFAEPEAANSPTSAVETTIIPELERIINDYTRAKTSKDEPRKKTIIVLTDGIWQGMHDEYTVDTYLRSTFHCLRDLHGDLTYIQPGQPHSRKDVSEIRPVTIQFVQFGDNKKAGERLRRLDDDLAKYGCP